MFWTISSLNLLGLPGRSPRLASAPFSAISIASARDTSTRSKHVVRLDLLLRLGLDPLEILRRDAVRQFHVVIKPVFHRRTRRRTALPARSAKSPSPARARRNGGCVRGPSSACPRHGSGLQPAAGSSAAFFSSAWSDIKRKNGQATYARPVHWPDQRMPLAKAAKARKGRMEKQAPFFFLAAFASFARGIASAQISKLNAPGCGHLAQDVLQRAAIEEAFHLRLHLDHQHAQRDTCARRGRYSARGAPAATRRAGESTGRRARG